MYATYVWTYTLQGPFHVDSFDSDLFEQHTQLAIQMSIESNALFTANANASTSNAVNNAANSNGKQCCQRKQCSWYRCQLRSP